MDIHFFVRVSLPSRRIVRLDLRYNWTGVQPRERWSGVTERFCPHTGVPICSPGTPLSRLLSFSYSVRPKPKELRWLRGLDHDPKDPRLDSRSGPVLCGASKTSRRSDKTEDSPSDLYSVWGRELDLSSFTRGYRK